MEQYREKEIVEDPPPLYQRPMDGGTGMHLLLCQLYSLELVPLFNGGWCTEEQEVE